jgi:hypothetical protein
MKNYLLGLLALAAALSAAVSLSAPKTAPERHWSEPFIGRALVTGREFLPSRAPAADTKKPLPTPQKVDSKLPTADAAIAGHYITHKVGVDKMDPRVHDGVDIIQVEVDALREELKSLAPGEKLEIFLNRYEIGDPRCVDVLVEAKKAGKQVDVYITTDMNVLMAGSFSEGKKFNSAFTKGTYNNTPMAEGMQKLLAAGYDLGNAKTHGKSTTVIYSQPLYDKGGGDSEIPIMHRKDLIMKKTAKGGEVKYRMFTGTGNMNPNPRFNRMFEITDPVICEYFITQSKAMHNAFAKGYEIKQIETPAPLRVVYPDGTFIEVAFTDGKYNPNDRIGVGSKPKFGETEPPKLPKVYEDDRDGKPNSRLNRAADPTDVKIKAVYFNHFVHTESGELYALRGAMEKQTDFKVFGVFDNKFAGTIHGFGLSPAIIGYNIDRKFGGPVQGFPSSLYKDRVEFYVYQKDIPGRSITDEDGPPTDVELDHDKTTVVDDDVLKSQQPGERREVFTGSLNNSNHFANAEVQLWMHLQRSSPIGQSVVDSITGIPKHEPEFALPMDLGIFREDFIAKLTGHSWPEVPLDLAKKIKGDFEHGNFDAAFDALKGLASEPTKLKKRVSPEELQVRLEKFKHFIEWYTTTSESAKKFKGIFAKKLIYAVTAVTHPDSAFSVKKGLSDAIWEAGVDRAVLDQRLEQVWKDVFGIKEPIPQPKDRAGSDAETASTGNGRARGGKGGKLADKCEGPLADPGYKIDADAAQGGGGSEVE